MTTRKSDGDAFIKRSHRDAAEVRAAYDKCLHDQTISSELKIDLKNLFGNLRSILDYLAHDIRETHCSSANPNAHFYFPILPDTATFQQRVNDWFPGLQSACVALWDYLESVQPYQSGFTWLGNFNRLNNENKHDSLVEQTRSEAERVNVSFNSGSVNWDPSAVKFGPGVSIGGVPVNPQTQLPVPHPSQTVQRIVWVDFQFQGIGQSAIQLVNQSVEGIETIANDLYQWL